MNIPRAKYYEWHSSTDVIYWTVAVGWVCAGTGMLLVAPRISEGRWFVAAFGACFAIAGLALFIRPRTGIDFCRGVITRESRLLGRHTIWTRQFNITDFTAVVMRHTIDRESGGTYFIGLRAIKGSTVWVRYIDIADPHCSRYAETIALALSADTGLPFDETLA